MKIAFVADLHFTNPPYGLFWSKDQHREFAREIHDHHPDVVMIGGDVSESYSYTSLLKECLELYKNPYGDSLFVPGNHDVWCINEDRDVEEKYEWNIRTAQRNGWFPLKDVPVKINNVWFCGNMGWYDLRSSPKYLGLTPEYYEKGRSFCDYKMTKLRDSHKKTPMLDFCKKRMKELQNSISKIPPEESLVVMTHIVGFKELLLQQDEGTAMFGNERIGKMILRYSQKRPSTLYLCGHTHGFVDIKINGIRCVNNGSDYSHKRIDIINI